MSAPRNPKGSPKDAKGKGTGGQFASKPVASQPPADNLVVVNMFGDKDAQECSAVLPKQGDQPSPSPPDDEDEHVRFTVVKDANGEVIPRENHTFSNHLYNSAGESDQEYFTLVKEDADSWHNGTKLNIQELQTLYDESFDELNRRWESHFWIQKQWGGEQEYSHVHVRKCVNAIAREYGWPTVKEKKTDMAAETIYEELCEHLGAYGPTPKERKKAEKEEAASLKRELQWEAEEREMEWKRQQEERDSDY